MLRYHFLASDFDPKFLILGESGDFAALAEVLAAFSDVPTATDLAERITPSASSPALSIVPANDRFGLRGADGGYHWRLNAYQAGVVAERLSALADPAVINGSDLLEVGSEGEIPVAISLGEFPDAYLHSRGP